MQENNSPEGPCEVKAIFGGARLACYFCQQERGGEGAGLEGPDFLFCNLPPISLFSFPPLLHSLPTTPADPSITSRQGFRSLGCTRTCLAHQNPLDISWIIFKCLGSDCVDRLIGVNGSCLLR